MKDKLKKIGEAVSALYCIFPFIIICLYNRFELWEFILLLILSVSYDIWWNGRNEK